MLINTAQGQVKWGITSGISTSHLDAGNLISSNINDSIRYTFTNTPSNYQIGTYLRLQKGLLYLKSDFILAYSQISYDKDDLASSNVAESLIETKMNLSIPIEIGLNYGYGIIHGGLVWSDFFRPEEQNVFLNFPSQLNEVFSNNKFGYRVGIGMDFSWQATIEFNYTYYSNFSNRIIIDNNVNYDFDYQPHSFTVNFSWNFVQRGWN